MFSILRRLARGSSPQLSGGFWNLDRGLLSWSRSDTWTIRDAFNGCLVLGATGSGKSSGSGRAIALSMLKAGFGGLVLTVKGDECEQWRQYCGETGRSNDLIEFDPADERMKFNFLDYERTRAGRGSGLTENLVQLFSIALEAAERGAGSSSGRDDDGYWKRACRQLVRNCVDVLLLAGQPITVPALYRIVVSAPPTRATAESRQWREQSYCFECITRAAGLANLGSQKADLELVADYFLVEFPSLAEKTRSVVVSTFTSMIDVLHRGVLREMLCTETTVSPDMVESGKVIVLNTPLKEFADVGRLAQVIFKYAFQRAIERRDVPSSGRPVFLWADEAQYFITSNDMHFQTTCRSARVATVMLSQNVSNFYAGLGGNEKGRAEADSIFGNLATKVFHANGDHVTNDWAAQTIGRSRQYLASASASYNGDQLFGLDLGLGDLGGNGGRNAGFHEVFEYEVQPAEFTQLRTGGPEHRRIVDAILFQNGKRFRATGKTWLRTSFQQSQGK